MAIIKAINSKSSIKSIMNYVSNDKKTSEELMTGLNCSSNAKLAIEEMKATKELYNKESGRQYKHFVQSFDPNDKLDPIKANKIGIEWAEKTFKGYEVFVATHTDKGHLHNHFVVNSVNLETGEKLNYSNKKLKEFKEISNEICQREGLNITRPNKESLTAFNSKKYKAMERGLEGDYKSYLIDLWKNVNLASKKAVSKDDFIKSMEQKDYKVNWIDTRKNITFITPEGKKVRDSNLAKTFKNDKLTKGGLLNEFSKNGARLSRGTRPEEAEQQINQTTRTEYESQNGVRKHTAQREFGAIEERIRAIEHGVKGDSKQETGRDNEELQSNSRTSTGTGNKQRAVAIQHEHRDDGVEQSNKSTSKRVNRKFRENDEELDR